MWDHVTVRVTDIAAAQRFYAPAMSTLGFRDPKVGEYVDWGDFSLAAATVDKPVTRGLHIAFLAASRDAVDDWWRAMTEAGHRDDGAPGPRPQYSESYYGAFVLDPDGNSVEAVHHAEPRSGENHIDHLWIGVADLAASKRFWETVTPLVGLPIAHVREERFHILGGGRSFALVHDGRSPTENVHLAFGVDDNEKVDEFHRVALAAGYEDNGAPGERLEYHPGYYGAFVLDPDGNNVEAVNHNRRR